MAGRINPVIPNIQTSWVKLGEAGIKACLVAGANDIGGTLMDETITRSAGARHGQEMSPQRMEGILAEIGRPVRQRTTLYGDVSDERSVASRTMLAGSGSCVMPLVAQSAAT